MIYPEFIKNKDVIGVTATSNGIIDSLKIKRFINAQKNLRQLGHNVIFTGNVFTALKRGESSRGNVRGDEFNQLVANKDVKAIIAAAGGDYLVEMLPYIDFENLQRNPKWVQGYSDNTSLLFNITTNYDIATVYGNNFSDFGMKKWEVPVIRNYEILSGKETVQTSFEMYEDGFKDSETGLEGYQCDQKVEWTNGRNETKINMQGRLIGGCTDVLFYISGTKYDGTHKFIEKYKEDGIIWFMETFACSSEDLIMHLWKLKEIGWFKYVKGFVFGRPLFFENHADISYEDAVMSMLGEYDVPIIFDADIGHKSPQFAMINGVVADITCQNGKGCIKYLF